MNKTNKQTREALQQLCDLLGYSYEEDEDGRIDIDDFPARPIFNNGINADRRKQPAPMEALKMLEEYLGIETFYKTSQQGYKKKPKLNYDENK